MGVRHEEKYLISYRDYALIKEAAFRVLTPDDNGELGHYVITSLYYDDPMDTALYEKLEGLPTHSKFRVRTYNSRPDVIRLERKDKTGIMTQKFSAALDLKQLPYLGLPRWELETFTGKAYELVSQMQATGQQPSITVRYERDAFYLRGGDLRLTFDTKLEVLPPLGSALFDPKMEGRPVLDSNTVVMEIKYGKRAPTFIRRLTDVPGKQLSVSKYALCREILLP